MTPQSAPNALRAARAARGWSLTAAARAIVEAGDARGVPVATVPSLRSQLSRWENGHALPDPPYRELLAELLGRTPTELGVAGPAADQGGGPADRLRAALAAANAIDESALLRWREQLDAARRLDDELGDAGAGRVVRAQVEQLEQTLTHTLDQERRASVARLLGAAAELAGAQALDRGEPDEAWRSYARARTAAAEGGDPVTAAAAVAGLATILVDNGDADSAVAILRDAAGSVPPYAAAQLAAALASAHAAGGDVHAAREALAATHHSLVVAPDDPNGSAGRVADGPGNADDQTNPRGDGRQPPGRPSPLPGLVVDPFHPAGPPIELAELHRWSGHVLTVLGDADAVPALRQALAAGLGSVRNRAGVHADLATALAPTDRLASAEQARTARRLAERIGSARIITAVSPLLSGP